VEGARPAQLADLAACARLIEAARDRAIAQRGGSALAAATGVPMPPAPVDEDWLAAWCAPGERAAFVGTVDEAVVGVGLAHVAAGDGAGTVGTIDCCYVEEGARGVGVGGALLEEMVSWCRAAGCTAVDAPALPGDRPTKQLLEAQGLSARLLILRRPLP